MSCCKSDAYLPMVFDRCADTERKIAAGESLLVNGQLLPTPILEEDLELYMEVTGSDTGGNGTEDKPFKTLHRCHEEVLKYIPGNYDITINIGPGTHIHSAGFKPKWLWGGSVTLQGERESLNSKGLTISGFYDFPDDMTAFGLSGTCLVNEAPSGGETDLDVSTVSLNTTVTTQIPIGAQFTISTETDTPIHMVTARSPASGTTTNITFNPALGSGVSNGDTITFLPRQGNPDYPSSYYHQLQFFDAIVDTSAMTETPRVGDFLAVQDVSGGTKPESLYGLHKCIDYDSGADEATIRVWQRSGVVDEPAGTVTISKGDWLRSVIAFEESVDDHALQMRGTHGGFWKFLVLEGNQNMFDTRRGIQCLEQGTIGFNNKDGIHNFDLGVEISGNASVEASTAYVSKCWTLGHSCQAGTTRFIGGTLNGCGTAAVWVQPGGHFSGAYTSSGPRPARFVACSKTYAVYCERGGQADFYNSDFYYEDSIFGPSGQCLWCLWLGLITARSSVFTGFTKNLEWREGYSNGGWIAASSGGYIPHEIP